MRSIQIILVALILACPQVSEAKPFTGKKDKQTQRDKGTTQKATKSVYDKLFKDKKLHTFSRGLMSVHRYEDKLYLELPLSLMGREFLVNPVIVSSSDLKLPLGVPAAKPQYVVIEKTDSLILFTMPGDYVRVNEPAENHRDAFRLSQANAVGRAFPIEGYTSDSTSVVFEATSYFTGANPDMLNLKGRSYDGLIYISNCSPQEKVSYVDEIRVFENCISITEAGTLQLTLAVIGLDYPDKPEVSVSLQMVMALLPEEKMKAREADPHIGSGYVTYTDYRDVNRVKKGYFATRREITLQKPVVFHMDPLLKPSWREAIRKSADEWNRVFEKVGVGHPLELRMYDTDSTFRPDDPLINTISFLDNDGADFSVYTITDPRSGEVLSSKISISRDFPFLVRRKGTLQMAELDERFRTYYIPDDLVCEGLTAYMLKAFGHSLGFVTNLASSMAYSPEQLRSPEFTQENGIAASVMDDVLYNYVARSGDKEKGVALVVSKPGICDEFALRYLYAPITGDEEETLKQWALQNKGYPLFFYGDSRTTGSNDPRCQQNDLGNDPFAAVDAKIERLKYIVQNSPGWLDRDDIPQSYRELFPSSVHSEFNRSLQTLFRYIGGVYMNVPDEHSDLSVYQPVPAEWQRKAVRKIIEVYEDLSWMDNREFLSLGGANSSMSDFVYRRMKMPVGRFMERLTHMETGAEKTKEEEPYTRRSFLDDIEKYVFAEVLEGKLLSENKITQAETYISGLISASPALKALQKTAVSSGTGLGPLTDNDFIPDDLMTYVDDNTKMVDGGEDDVLLNMKSPASVRFSGKPGNEALYYEKLADARRLLQKAQSLAADGIIRGKIAYLIMMIDRVLLQDIK